MQSFALSKRGDRGAYNQLSQNEAGVELASVPHDGDARPSDSSSSSTRKQQQTRYEDASPTEYHETKSGFPERDSYSDYERDVDEPTDAERVLLRKIPDKLPWSASLIAIVELCERFAYYGLSGPFQNYMANSYADPSGLPGAIGLGQHGATFLSSCFQFWCYLTPIFGAIVADQYLGKYKTIVYFALIYMVGIVILFLTSLPLSIEYGLALPGLLAAMLVIGLGTGGIKSNVSPLIAEQYRETKARIRVLKSGERVIVDPALTIQRIYMVFYMCINIGSLSALATTTIELRIGFWAAYLLPLSMFVIGFVVIVLGKNRYVIRPPTGSVIANSFKALWIAMMCGANLDAAKPSNQEVYGYHQELPWDDVFIEELKRAVKACKVFSFYPIYWAAFNQMSNNFISQAGQMELHKIPNDIMQNIDPVVVIILIPIMEHVMYPFLRKIGFPMKPITRIYFGFFFAAIAMAYAATLQHLIYTTGPCYYQPSNCEAGLWPNGRYAPNHVHVAMQTPAYFFLAISEILASVTGLEYAFTKAPSSMKSFIMAMYLMTTAVGAAFGAAISPFARDPLLVWLYSGLAIACLVAGGVFWSLFNQYNEQEDSMNELDGAAKRVPLASMVHADAEDAP